MAEAIGLVASIVAVIELAKGVTCAVLDYGKAYHNSSTDVKALHDEIFSLIGVLDFLKDRTDEEAQETEKLRVPLSLCQDVLKKLLSKIPPVKPGEKLGGLKRIMWPFKDGEIKEQLEKLSRAKSTLQLSLAADQGVDMKGIKEMCEGIQITTSSTLAIVETARKEQQEAKKATESRKLTEAQQEALKWLHNDVDFESSHKAARKLHKEGTGNWFLNSNYFWDWLNGKQSRMWLHGIPGAGKTILMSSIIDSALTRLKLLYAGGFSMAYFYFSFRHPETQTAVNMLSSVLAQILSQVKDTVFPDKVLELHKKFKSQPGRPDAEELLDLIEEVVSGAGPVYIFLDALDECSEAEWLQSLHDGIERLVSIENMRLVCTSRREGEIENSLVKLMSFQGVSIQSEAVDNDIRLFVTELLNKDLVLKRQSDATKAKIFEKMSSGASGMFRWVECQIEQLRKCRTGAQIGAALNRLPRTLHETYERILFETPEENKDYLRRALAWIMYSKQDIRLVALAEAMALTPGLTALDENTRLISPSDPDGDIAATIQAVCGCLVRCEKSDQHWRDPWEVSLAHFSVQEYLLSDDILAGPSKFFSLREDAGNDIILEACFIHLQLKCFEATSGHSLNKRETGPIAFCWPLYPYVAHNWQKHVSPHREASLLAREANFFQPNPFSSHFRFWRAYVDKDGDDDDHGPLFYMCGFGLAQAVTELIKRGDSIRELSTTSLHHAARTDRPEIINCLIEIGGADVLWSDQQGDLPIHVAARQQCPSTLKALIERMEDVDIRNANGDTALHIASDSLYDIYMRRGLSTNNKLDSTAVGVLLQGGANPNLLKSNGLTLAHVFASRPQGGLLFDFLLRHGADPDLAALDSEGWSIMDYLLPTREDTTTAPAADPLASICVLLRELGWKIQLPDYFYSELEYHMFMMTLIGHCKKEKCALPEINMDFDCHALEASKLLKSTKLFNNPFVPLDTICHTPFTYTVVCQFYELLEVMIVQGLDLEQRCLKSPYSSGAQTALEWSIDLIDRSKTPEKITIIQFLCDHGAVITNQVATKLFLRAIQRGPLTLLEYLFERQLAKEIELQGNFLERLMDQIIAYRWTYALPRPTIDEYCVMYRRLFDKGARLPEGCELRLYKATHDNLRPARLLLRSLGYVIEARPDAEPHYRRFAIKPNWIHSDMKHLLHQKQEKSVLDILI